MKDVHKDPGRDEGGAGHIDVELELSVTTHPVPGHTVARDRVVTLGDLELVVGFESLARDASDANDVAHQVNGLRLLHGDGHDDPLDVPSESRRHALIRDLRPG